MPKHPSNQDDVPFDALIPFESPSPKRVTIHGDLDEDFLTQLQAAAKLSKAQQADLAVSMRHDMENFRCAPLLDELSAAIERKDKAQVETLHEQIMACLSPENPTVLRVGHILEMKGMK